MIFAIRASDKEFCVVAICTPHLCSTLALLIYIAWVIIFYLLMSIKKWIRTSRFTYMGKQAASSVRTSLFVSVGGKCWQWENYLKWVSLQMSRITMTDHVPLISDFWGGEGKVGGEGGFLSTVSNLYTEKGVINLDKYGKYVTMTQAHVPRARE